MPRLRQQVAVSGTFAARAFYAGSSYVCRREFTSTRVTPIVSGPQGDPPPNPPAAESDRLAGGGIGGAILGASLGGPPGALIGGIIGLILAGLVNEEKRKEQRPGGSQ